MKQLLVLGGGTAGSMVANQLVGRLPEGWNVTVVDRDDLHVYQPGLLFVPFGQSRPDEIVRRRARILDPRVTFIEAELDRIGVEDKIVTLRGARTLPWDVLVIATGTRIRPDQTPGMAGEGWGRDVFDFYTLEGASALAKRLDGLEGGRLVIDVVDMPIKCPVAPLEFAFLADAYFTERGIRDRVEIAYLTPLDGAFTRPRASQVLGDMLSRRGIEVIPQFGAAEVDGAGRTIKAFDGRSERFDLLVTVPLHGGAQVISDSGLGDPLGFVPTEKHSLRSKAHSDIFVLGDATDLPTSKAGAVAHFQAETLVPNVLRHIAEQPLLETFDGHANCFIETGHGKAMLIDFNYATEPLPGRFPLPGVGPFTLLEESHVNHWGKLAFRWVYWNLLVRGKELPLEHKMALAGKWS